MIVSLACRTVIYTTLPTVNMLIRKIKLNAKISRISGKIPYLFNLGCNFLVLCFRRIFFANRPTIPPLPSETCRLLTSNLW